MSIYMLFDGPEDQSNTRFLQESAVDILPIYPAHRCTIISAMYAACRECIHNTVVGDTIIYWYDFMGVILWWLCLLTRRKLNIIIVNILLKDKRTMKNRLAKALYRPVLKAHNVQATVTSVEYGEYLNRILGIHESYTLLHDIYHDGYKCDINGSVAQNSVFCGGRNGRDWTFLLELAAAMPDVQFHCVLPRDQYEQYRVAFEGRCNVEALCDVPGEEFLSQLRRSQLVVMPLDTEAPAGLIVLFQAAANSKMVITSDTVTTREYITSDRGVRCKRDVTEWMRQIRYYLQHTQETADKAGAFKVFLTLECSEAEFAQILMEMAARFD